MKRPLFIIGAIAVITVLPQCRDREIGTTTNPVILEVLSSSPLNSVIKSIENIAKYIERSTALKVGVYAPNRYIDYIVALSNGNRKADVAILNDVGYLFANDEFGATAELITLRRDLDGELTREYCSAIITVNLQSLQEIKGRTLAFSDEYSTAGYLIPYYNLKEKGVLPGKSIFAGSYLIAMRALMRGEVDAAAIYTSCKGTNNELDSRIHLLNEYPDIFIRTKILFKSSPLPNEPVVFRKGLKKEIKEKIKEALLKCPEDQICRDSLLMINYISGFERIDGSEYNRLRTIIKSMEKSTADLVPGGWILRIKNSPSLPLSGD